MENQNATTQEITRGCDKCVSQDQSDRLEQVGNDRSVNGNDEQSGFATGDRSRRNSTRANCTYGDTHFGKILQRLNRLEKMHYEYVHVHQDQLQARLDESKKSEETFRREAQELRQEILTLATQESVEIQPE